MLKGPRAAEAGIVYLQDETCEFRTKENGKIWTVYGSPVRSSVFNHDLKSNVNASFSTSGLQNFATGHSTTNERMGKVVPQRPFFDQTNTKMLLFFRTGI